MGDAVRTWLTVAEIATRLGRPVSTIRSWRDRYRSYVPEAADGRGRQTYPYEVLAEIQHLHTQRLTPREIKQELARRHATPGDGSGAPPAPDRLTQILERLERIERKLDLLLAREQAREA